MSGTITSFSGVRTKCTPCFSRALIGQSVKRLEVSIPPREKGVGTVLLGMGMLVSAATMSASGLTPEEEMVCLRKSASVVP